MAEAIDTAFVEIVPDFRNFQGKVKDGIERGIPPVAPRFDDGGIRRGARDATRSLTGVGTAATLMGGTVSRAGLIAGAGLVGIGAAGTLAAVEIAQAGIEFESAFAGVRKTVDASEGTLDRIAGEFIDLSTEIPVTTTELSALGEAAGQLGIETGAITEFTKTTAELGATTNLASIEAADALARLANITQLPQDQFDNLGSTIVALGNKTASTEAEIVEFGLRISGAGHQIGLTQDEILAFGAALASVGLNAEAGGTAISTTFIRIASAVEKGGKDLDNFAQVAGQSAEAFAESFETNPARAVTAFIRGLGEVRDEGGSVFATLESLGLGGIRVRDALLRAAGAGDLLSDSLRIGNDAWQENNALQREAQTRFSTTASEITLAKNEVKALAIELSGPLVSGTGTAAKAIGGLAGAARSAVQALKDAGEPDFDTVNADLSELVDQFAKLNEDATYLSSITPFEGLTKDQQEILDRLLEIGKALNDTPAGLEKFTAAFSDVSEDVRKAMQDGIITPAERAELQTTALGRAFVKALPRDVFVGLGASARSSIEEAAHAVQRGGPLVGAALRSAIEDASRIGVAVAAEEGAKVGESLATSLAQAASQAVQRSNLIGAASDEAVDAAIAAGSESDQIAALKKKRDSLVDAIEKIEAIKNPGKARIAQRRTLRKQLAGVTVQIAGIESGIVADQKAAQAESEAKARDAAAAAQDRDRDLVTGLERSRGDEERAVIRAQATKKLSDDLATNEALQDAIRADIASVKKRVKDIDIRNQALDGLRDDLARARADGQGIRAEIAQETREALESRQETRAEGLADITQIAALRGDQSGQEKALRAEIAHWSKVERAAKDGTEKQRKALLTLEQKKKELRDLKEQVASTDSGTSIAGFLTENTDLFKGIASNIGAAGIDPLSGFDFSKSLVSSLTRLQQAAPSAAGAVSVDGVIAPSRPAGGADNSIERLIAALDRNTQATSGNTTASGTTGLNARAVNAYGARYEAMAQAWEARRARKLQQDAANG